MEYRPNAVPGLYSRPRSRFFHTDRLSSVIRCLLYGKQEQFDSFNRTGLH